jgi:hypothetical protein
VTDSVTPQNRGGVYKHVLLAAVSTGGLAVAAYTLIAPPETVPSPSSTAELTAPACWYLLLLFLTLLGAVAGLLGLMKGRSSQQQESGLVPLSPTSVTPYVLSQRRYGRIFVTTAVAYGVLYSFLTGILAYRPDIDFSAFPGLAIPSAQPDQLIGAPLYVPEVTVFITNHFAMVLVPLTLILMVVVSVLVGVNSALAAFAYDNRSKGSVGMWRGQLGAIVGLFTGCPTCAGLYFYSLVGGSGAVSFAVALGYYQPLFVLLSVPVLLLSPYLISRSLSKVFRDGCIVLGEGHHFS